MNVACNYPTASTFSPWTTLKTCCVFGNCKKQIRLGDIAICLGFINVTTDDMAVMQCNEIEEGMIDYQSSLFGLVFFSFQVLVTLLLLYAFTVFLILFYIL